MSIDNHPSTPAREMTTDADAISRRAFLIFSCCCCGAAANRAGGAEAKPVKPVDIGVASDYPKDGIYDKFTSDDFFVARCNGRLFAITSICSHMAEPLLRDSLDSTRIKCTGHESMFDNEGRVMVGPASVSLARLGISRDKEGRITVDPKKQFPEDKWDDAGAFLELT